MAYPTISHNTPSAGHISWTGFGLAFDGVNYEVPAGSTDKKFTWWQYAPSVTEDATFTVKSGALADWTALNTPNGTFTHAPTGWGALASSRTVPSEVTLRAKVRLTSSTSVAGVSFGNAANYSSVLLDARNASGASAAVHIRSGVATTTRGTFPGTLPTIATATDYWLTVQVGVGSVAVTVATAADGVTIYSGTVVSSGITAIDWAGVVANGVATISEFAAVPAVRHSDTLPNDLQAEDYLLFLNRNGIGMLAPTAQVIDGSLIVSGSIYADAIGANQIDTWHLKANAITADQIAANAVGAEEIAAGAVTTSKLSVGSVGDNLISNGSFEDGTEGWEYVSGTGSADVVTGVASSGANALRITRSSGNVHVRQDPSKYVPVSPVAGRRLYCAVRAGAAATMSSSFVFRVQWFDSTKTTASSYNDIVSWGSLSTSWTLFEGAVTIPAGAAYAAISVYIGNVSGQAFIDEVIVREVIVSAQIGDGAITTPKLVANAVTTEKIAANAVTANEIATGTITASSGIIASLDAGVITVGVLDASLIAANAIVGEQLIANTVTTRELAAGAVTTPKLLANSVTADKINVGSLTANSAFVEDVQAMGVKIKNAEDDVVVNLTGTGEQTVGVLNDTGDLVAGIDSAGTVLGRRLVANQGIQLGGRDLVTMLDGYSRTIARGSAWLGSPGGQKVRDKVGFVKVGANVTAGHRYRAYVRVPEHQTYQSDAELYVGLGILYGTNVTIASHVLAGAWQWTPRALVWESAGREMVAEWTASHTGLLSAFLFGELQGNGRNTPTANIDVWGTASLVIDDLGPEVPDVGVNDRAGGAWYQGSTSTTPEKRTYDTYYAASGFKSFLGSGAVNSGTQASQYAMQGRSPSFTTPGSQSSHIYFPYSTIRADLAGSTIEAVAVYVHNAWTHYGAGGTVRLASHNYGSNPGSLGTISSLGDFGIARGEGKWIWLPTTFGDALKSSAAGVAFSGFGSTDPQFYAYFHPLDTQIFVRYTK